MKLTSLAYKQIAKSSFSVLPLLPIVAYVDL